jgi:hypothetical protein
MSTPLTAASLDSPHPMPGWIRQGLIAIGVVVACWGGAIVWWRVSGRTPDAPEWMSLLFGLPLALLLVGLIGARWRLPRAAASGAAAPVVDAGPASVATPHLAILATSLRTPHADAPEALAAAIAANRARPDLDRELVDDDGFPVLCARCPDADADAAALREDVGDWLAARGATDPQYGDEQWRALTLATSVAAELAARAVIEWIVHDDAAPRLQVLPLLPADWSGTQRDAAAAWLLHTVAQSGWKGETALVVPDADPAASIVKLAGIAGGGGTPAVTLVVACASHVGHGTVARWASERTLFTAAQPQGMIPGEGAAGLLVGGAALAGASDGLAVALLAPVEAAQDDVQPGARARGDGSVLEGLVAKVLAKVLAEARVDPASVAMIVADTGHRSRHVYELMEYAATTMRQLDGSDDVISVGTAVGDAGIVPFVTALALAPHYAAGRAAPVLCIANDIPGRRLVTLVRPVA